MSHPVSDSKVKENALLFKTKKTRNVNVTSLLNLISDIVWLKTHFSLCLVFIVKDQFKAGFYLIDRIAGKISRLCTRTISPLLLAAASMHIICRKGYFDHLERLVGNQPLDSHLFWTFLRLCSLSLKITYLASTGKYD